MQINYDVLKECISGEKDISSKVSSEILPLLGTFDIKLKKSLIGHKFGKTNLSDVNPLPFIVALSYAKDIFPYLNNNSFSKPEANIVFFEYLKMHYGDTVKNFVNTLWWEDFNLMTDGSRKLDNYFWELSKLEELKYHEAISPGEEMKYMSLETQINTIKKSFASRLVKKGALNFEKNKEGSNYFNKKDSLKYVVKIPKVFLKL